jgi:hypothetical protein
MDDSRVAAPPTALSLTDARDVDLLQALKDRARAIQPGGRLAEAHLRITDDPVWYTRTSMIKQVMSAQTMSVATLAQFLRETAFVVRLANAILHRCRLLAQERSEHKTQTIKSRLVGLKNELRPLVPGEVELQALIDSLTGAAPNWRLIAAHLIDGAYGPPNVHHLHAVSGGRLGFRRAKILGEWLETTTAAALTSADADLRTASTAIVHDAGVATALREALGELAVGYRDFIEIKQEKYGPNLAASLLAMRVLWAAKICEDRTTPPTRAYMGRADPECRTWSIDSRPESQGPVTLADMFAEIARAYDLMHLRDAGGKLMVAVAKRAILQASLDAAQAQTPKPEIIKSIESQLAQLADTGP